MTYFALKGIEQEERAHPRRFGTDKRQQKHRCPSVGNRTLNTLSEDAGLWDAVNMIFRS